MYVNLGLDKNKVILKLKQKLNTYTKLYNSIVDNYTKQVTNPQQQKDKKNLENALLILKNKYHFEEMINDLDIELQKGYHYVKKSIRPYYLLQKNTDMKNMLDNMNTYAIVRMLFNVVLIKSTELISNIKHVINEISPLIKDSVNINEYNQKIQKLNKDFETQFMLLSADENKFMNKMNKKYNKLINNYTFSKDKKQNVEIQNHRRFGIWYLYCYRLNKVVNTLFVKFLAGDSVCLSIINAWRKNIMDIGLELPRTVPKKIFNCIFRLYKKLNKFVEKIKGKNIIECGINNIPQYVIPYTFNIRKIGTIDSIFGSTLTLDNFEQKLGVNAIIINAYNQPSKFIYNKDITDPNIVKLDTRNYNANRDSTFKVKNISRGKIRLMQEELAHIRDKFANINLEGINERNNTLTTIVKVVNNKNATTNKVTFNPKFDSKFVLILYIGDNKYALIGDRNNNVTFNKLTDIPAIIRIFNLFALTHKNDLVDKIKNQYDPNGFIKQKNKQFQMGMHQLKKINNKYLNALNLIKTENEYQNNLFMESNQMGNWFNVNDVINEYKKIKVISQSYIEDGITKYHICCEEDNQSSHVGIIEQSEALKRVNNINNNLFNKIKLEIVNRIIGIYNRKMKNLLNNETVQYYKLQRFIPVFDKGVVFKSILYLGISSYDQHKRFKLYSQYATDKLLTQKIIIDQTQKNTLPEKYIVKTVNDTINQAINNLKNLQEIKIK